MDEAIDTQSAIDFFNRLNEDNLEYRQKEYSLNDLITSISDGLRLKILWFHPTSV